MEMPMRNRPVLFVAICLTWLSIHALAQDATQTRVGRIDDAALMTPVHQRITPYGKWTDLPGMRPQAVAISPDGSFGITSGKTSKLVVFDPETGEILDRVDMPSETQAIDASPNAANNLKPDDVALLSFTGLLFSPDGKQIYLSNVQGSIKVFSVERLRAVKPSHVLKLPNADAPKRKQEIPSGMAFSSSGDRLYIC
jgi:WD40 repeat protein